MSAKVKVTIQSITRQSQWGREEETQVLIDDKPIGGGDYGGEPKDNYRFRAYSWVEPLLKRLAHELGADVEIVKRDVSADEDE